MNNLENDLEQTEKEIRRIEWFLKPKVIKKKDYNPSYGNLAEINTSRVLLDSVGVDILIDIVGEYLNLLETSSAIYEKNGDYALGIFTSGWCRFLDQASRNLCATDDNRKALESGKWLCHESCWTQASKISIETGQPVDILCQGGIRLYAIPIWAGGEIVGSINFGYGNPPQDPQKLQEIAERYSVNMDELLKHAESYQYRPSFIIDMAKRCLIISAEMIGAIVELKNREQKLKESEHKLKERVKELTCLYGISKLIENEDISLDEFLEGILDLILSAWQFPEITCPIIKYDEKEYKTHNSKETDWKISTNVKINEKLMTIEVYYLEDKPFLKEEENLINDIGIRLKVILEQKEAEQKLFK